ncbi:hypothetical protein niasHT_003277 [Heterodera trifolii]|uniref:RING-type domain-containing protein n=1 Tax=Heterodera trifolii TaxID=157864 RepID=A0ABD2LQV9_9BILA
MHNIEFIAFAFLALFEFGLAQPKPKPENDNVQPIASETDSSAQVQNPLNRAPVVQQTVDDIAHPTTYKNESSGEAQTVQVSGPSVHKMGGENTPKDGENSQPSKDMEPGEHKEAIASPKKPSPKSDWESALSQNFAKFYQSPKRKTAISPLAKGKNIENSETSKDPASDAHRELGKEKNEENAQTSKDPPTSAGGQNKSIPSPKKPSPRGKSKSDFGLNLAKAFPGPVPKGKKVENTQSSTPSASEAHKELAKEKNEENAQTSKDPPTSAGAKMGEEAQSSKDPTMNGQICAICLDASLITDLELSKCHHRFHRECVDGWFKNNDTCPYCRAVVASRYLPRPTRTDRI